MGRKQIFRVFVSQVLFLGDELSQTGTDMQVVEDARRPFVSGKYLVSPSAPGLAGWFYSTCDYSSTRTNGINARKAVVIEIVPDMPKVRQREEQSSSRPYKYMTDLRE